MKTLLLKLDHRYLNLVLSVGFALLLLLVRTLIAQNIFYWFLPWNLFLAALPYMITQGLLYKYPSASEHYLFGLFFATWLLLLPNSPYIITDLVHLHNEHSFLVWIDLFLVFVFACNGLLFGLLSLLDMKQLLLQRFSSSLIGIILFIVCMLSGYGIYLGRFLRFNSWDIIARPLTLFGRIFDSLLDPYVWGMTFAFGGFLWILFLLFQSFRNK